MSGSERRHKLEPGTRRRLLSILRRWAQSICYTLVRFSLLTPPAPEKSAPLGWKARSCGTYTCIVHLWITYVRWGNFDLYGSRIWDVKIGWMVRTDILVHVSKQSHCVTVNGFICRTYSPTCFNLVPISPINKKRKETQCTHKHRCVAVFVAHQCSVAKHRKLKVVKEWNITYTQTTRVSLLTPHGSMAWRLWYQNTL